MEGLTFRFFKYKNKREKIVNNKELIDFLVNGTAAALMSYVVLASIYVLILFPLLKIGAIPMYASLKIISDYFPIKGISERLKIPNGKWRRVVMNLFGSLATFFCGFILMLVDKVSPEKLFTEEHLVPVSLGFVLSYLIFFMIAYHTKDGELFQKNDIESSGVLKKLLF